MFKHGAAVLLAAMQCILLLSACTLAYLANQLHNLIEVILLLQHLTHCLPDVDEVWVKLLVEWLQ